MHNDAAPMYALRDECHCDIIVPGRTMIGRSGADPDGVDFVAIESPRGAMSRLQAVIEIAPNGDAWINDLESTNGTYVSVRPGTGIKLAPNCVYQLSDGCSILFGDVERRFVAVTAEEARLSLAARTTQAASTVNVSQALAFSHLSAGAAGSERASSRQASARTSPSAALRNVPYLADLHEPLSGTKRPRATTSEGTDTRQETPKSRSRQSAASPPADALQPPGQPVCAPLVVCMSGMDPEDKIAARKAVKRHGGSCTEDMAKATLLLVGEPAVRTPKFIIAVGRCVPIVPLKCLEVEGPLTKKMLSDHIVTLKDNAKTYTSAALRSAIFRANKDRLLTGLAFDLKELRGKSKQVVQDVITACGGEIVRKKNETGAPIDSDKAVDSLYDSILRGKRP